MPPVDYVVVTVLVVHAMLLGVAVWLLRDLTLGFQTFVDWHMRVAVAQHKELCQLNTRFTPMQSMPSAPRPSEEALAALRGGKPA